MSALGLVPAKVRAIKDTIMASVSPGQPGVSTTYDFDAPFTIVSLGMGFRTSRR